MRPIVACDIDGTLGDYHAHFTKFAADYLQRWLPNNYIGDGKFADHLGIPREEYRQIKLAYRQGAQKRSMPRFEALIEGIRHLPANGVEVWLTTTRPYLRLDNIDPDTRFWLQQADITYHALLYDEDKYEVLAAQTDPSRVIAIIDDLPEQVNYANDIFHRRAFDGEMEEDIALCVARPHNRASGMPRTSDGEIIKIVNRRLSRWID